jgi:2-methylisocitrate lyase-like PEP mutase family enzyme
MNTFQTFKELHNREEPLLIGNIWDAHSAQIYERNGFNAIATSSAAVANSYGYDDGEKLPFELLVQLATTVVKKVTIPLSVDIEGGYNRTGNGIGENIRKLLDVGVVGVNLEDTLSGSQRTLQPEAEFVKVLIELANYLDKHNCKVFLNIRTDGFLLGMPNALNETLARIKAYEKTGVHGMFVPCVEDKQDIQKLVACSQLPINVMCMPNLPNFVELAALGVKRISMGNFFHQSIMKTVETKLQRIMSDQSFKSVFS